LITLDEYVDERNTDGVPAFCGSAYDVALLKGDGVMGGEVPPNQAAIDTACQRRERTRCLQVSPVSRAWLRLPTRCFCRGGPLSRPGSSRRPSCAPSDGLRRVTATFYD
jgi:hypothetical protein